MFLALWATPRSTSTAFEWMMRQRGDFHCVHEPFNEVYYYGEDKRSNREEVEPRPGHTYDSVWAELLAQGRKTSVFVKEHAYSVGDDLDEERFAAIDQHSFLLRDPKRVIQGMAKYWPDVEFEEVGFEALHLLFDRVAESTGAVPPVVHSDDLLRRPRETTEAYCKAVDIPFIEEALSWEAGPRTEVKWYGSGDNPWHDNLTNSTGFSQPKTQYPPLEDDARLVELYERSVPHYEALDSHRLVPLQAAE